MEKKLKGQATPEQIAEWKKKHGDVFALQGDGHICYIRKPHRKELSMALSKAIMDPLGSSESILQNCWLDGSTELQTDDELFMGVHQSLQEIISTKEVEVKKL